MKSGPFGFRILPSHCLLGLFLKNIIKELTDSYPVWCPFERRARLKCDLTWLSYLGRAWPLLPFSSKTAPVIFKKSTFDYCFYFVVEKKNEWMYSFLIKGHGFLHLCFELGKQRKQMAASSSDTFLDSKMFPLTLELQNLSSSHNLSPDIGSLNILIKFAKKFPPFKGMNHITFLHVFSLFTEISYTVTMPHNHCFEFTFGRQDS